MSSPLRASPVIRRGEKDVERSVKASKSGYLLKQGEYVKSTNRRYFELYLNPPFFVYYKSEGGAHIKTVRLLGEDNEVVIHQSQPATFYVQTSNRVWLFTCESTAEFTAWVQMFRRACTNARLAARPVPRQLDLALNFDDNVIVYAPAGPLLYALILCLLRRERDLRLTILVATQTEAEQVQIRVERLKQMAVAAAAATASSSSSEKSTTQQQQVEDVKGMSVNYIPRSPSGNTTPVVYVEVVDPDDQSALAELFSGGSRLVMIPPTLRRVERVSACVTAAQHGGFIKHVSVVLPQAYDQKGLFARQRTLILSELRESNLPFAVLELGMELDTILSSVRAVASKQTSVIRGILAPQAVIYPLDTLDAALFISRCITNPDMLVLESYVLLGREKVTMEAVMELCRSITKTKKLTYERIYDDHERFQFMKNSSAGLQLDLSSWEIRSLIDTCVTISDTYVKVNLDMLDDSVKITPDLLKSNEDTLWDNVLDDKSVVMLQTVPVEDAIRMCFMHKPTKSSKTFSLFSSMK